MKLKTTAKVAAKVAAPKAMFELRADLCKEQVDAIASLRQLVARGEAARDASLEKMQSSLYDFTYQMEWGNGVKEAQLGLLAQRTLALIEESEWPVLPALQAALGETTRNLTRQHTLTSSNPFSNASAITFLEAQQSFSDVLRWAISDISSALAAIEFAAL